MFNIVSRGMNAEGGGPYGSMDKILEFTRTYPTSLILEKRGKLRLSCVN
jgi:hypothetical protein